MTHPPSSPVTDGEREKLLAILRSAMSWHPSEDGDSYVEALAALTKRLDATRSRTVAAPFDLRSISPDTVELLPCPFCGVNPVLAKRDWYDVVCENLNCSVAVEVSEPKAEDAIASWNGRIGGAAQAAPDREQVATIIYDAFPFELRHGQAHRFYGIPNASGRPRMCGMRLVILESPYAGDVEKNVAYARACVRDSLSRGEAPIASHLLYTQPGILRDEVAEERQWGIDAGLAWGAKAEATVLYCDLGISRGMEFGIANAERAGRAVERRSLSLAPADRS